MVVALKDVDSRVPAIKATPSKTRERAEFDSHMVMVAYAVSNSSAEDARHFGRRLQEELAYLSRKHGIKF